MRKPDAYEARARELCAATGVEPDSRIGEGRGRPAWTDFRDAARAEHVAAEQAALKITLPEQAERFKRSPLTIFGQHDEGTKEQMRNCMKVGNVVAGAIMADGHLGYAQPVGGVVAYEDQISVSGVGFDIACVDGETEFLSDAGWVRMDSWAGHRVAQYDLKTGKASFIQPKKYIKVPATLFYLFKTKFGVDQKLTPNHRMLIYAPGPNREFAEGRTITAEELANHHNNLVLGVDDRINTSFEMETDDRIELSDEDIAITVMTCADACFERRNGQPTEIAVLALKKPRKIARAQQLLEGAEIPFHKVGPNKGGYTVFRYRAPVLTKSLYYFWAASRHQLGVIVDEVLMWDGNLTQRCYYTRDKASADFVHYAFAATGRRSVMRQDGKDFRIFAQPNTKVGLKASPHNPVLNVVAEPGEHAYCFQVPTGFFVIRRGGQIAITGNCGNMAVQLAVPYSEIKDSVGPILRDINNTISFGVGRVNDERVEHELLDDVWAWDAADMLDYRAKAASQLGTVGSGNHYVDLMVDESGLVWIGVHFGSRGLGHTSATKYLKLAGGKDGMNVPPTVLPIDNELGQRYIHAMELAGRYAYAGREWVVERVRKLIGFSEVIDTVHNHHNYAWQENHDGHMLWVVRKGATPAFPGQRGFVGGSMGDDAVIIRGAGTIGDAQEASPSLYSTVHGAGRLFGRKEAKRRFTREEMDTWLRKYGVTLVGGDLDESPMAYRRLPEVLAAHKNTIEIEHYLRPFGVVMAGEGEFDPFKD